MKKTIVTDNQRVVTSYRVFLSHPGLKETAHFSMGRVWSINHALWNLKKGVNNSSNSFSWQRWLIWGTGWPDTGDPSNQMQTSSIAYPSSSRASYLLYKNSWEGEVERWCIYQPKQKPVFVPFCLLGCPLLPGGERLMCCSWLTHWSQVQQSTIPPVHLLLWLPDAPQTVYLPQKFCPKDGPFFYLSTGVLTAAVRYRKVGHTLQTETWMGASSLGSSFCIAVLVPVAGEATGVTDDFFGEDTMTRLPCKKLTTPTGSGRMTNTHPVHLPMPPATPLSDCLFWWCSPGFCMHREGLPILLTTAPYLLSWELLVDGKFLCSHGVSPAQETLLYAASPCSTAECTYTRGPQQTPNKLEGWEITNHIKFNKR